MRKKYLIRFWSMALGLGTLLLLHSTLAMAEPKLGPSNAQPRTQNNSVMRSLTLPSSTTTEPTQAAQDPTSQAAPLSSQEEFERGTILLRLGNPREAAQSFGRIIQREPSNLAAHQALRRALVQSHQTNELKAALPSLISVLNNHGHHTLAGQRLTEFRVLNPSPKLLQRLERELQSSMKSGTSNTLTSIWDRLRSLLGMFVLLGIAYLLSANRSKINFRLVSWGMGLQFVFAIIILWTPPGRWVFDTARIVIQKILSFTDEGARFLFGSLYNGMAPLGAQGPVQLMDGTTGDFVNVGMVIAFHILPTVIFFGALMSVLYHLRIIQAVVRVLAWVMVRTMGTSGAESLSAASNVFVGQTEAPLVIRPFLNKMTSSELMAIMVGGFATVAGGVLAAYTQFGVDPGHLLAASVMSAPAALAVAKILYPEVETSMTHGEALAIPPAETTNVIDAAAAGAADGLKLALNVAAMLIAFIALIAMLNWIVGSIGLLLGFDELSLKQIFGVVFYPISWCMGVHQSDLIQFGNLLGTKVSINEFVAFLDLIQLKGQMTERSFTIGTYALCGFANFSSIGIQIGGISSIAPGRRKDLAVIGLKAMIGGAIASWLTACIAGVLL